MSRRIMLIPVGTSVGLTTVSMGLVRAIEEQGIKLNFFKPVAQPRRGDNGEERSTAIIAHHASVSPITPFELDYVERMISNDSTDELLEEIIERFVYRVEVIGVHKCFVFPSSFSDSFLQHFCARL